MPAVLKGYIYRVFSNGFAYEISGNGTMGLLNGKKVLIINTTGGSKEAYEESGMFKIMNLQIDDAIFGFCGLEVVGHKHFSSVPYVRDSDGRQILDEIKTLVGKLL